MFIHGAGGTLPVHPGPALASPPVPSPLLPHRPLSQLQPPAVPQPR